MKTKNKKMNKKSTRCKLASAIYLKIIKYLNFYIKPNNNRQISFLKNLL